MGTKQRGTVFSLGLVLGSLGGFIVGMLFGKHLIALASMIAGMVLRREPGDKQRPKFEWLLQ
ncbi:MAG: hypothetical protein WBA46_05760 [Thermomicrobiales bacterium]